MVCQPQQQHRSGLVKQQQRRAVKGCQHESVIKMLYSATPTLMQSATGHTVSQPGPCNASVGPTWCQPALPIGLGLTVDRSCRQAARVEPSKSSASHQFLLCVLTASVTGACRPARIITTAQSQSAQHQQLTFSTSRSRCLQSINPRFLNWSKQNSTSKTIERISKQKCFSPFRIMA